MNLEILKTTGGLNLLQQDRCIDCPSRKGGSVGKFAAICFLGKNYKAEGCTGSRVDAHIFQDVLGIDGEFHPEFKEEVRGCEKDKPMPEGYHVVTLNHCGNIRTLHLPKLDVYYDYTEEHTGPHHIPDATPLD